MLGHILCEHRTDCVAKILLRMMDITHIMYTVNNGCLAICATRMIDSWEHSLTGVHLELQIRMRTIEKIANYPMTSQSPTGVGLFHAFTGAVFCEPA